MRDTHNVTYQILLIPLQEDIYIKNSIPQKVIYDTRDNTSGEYLSVKIFLDGKTIPVINVYTPHDSEVVLKPPDYNDT